MSYLDHTTVVFDLMSVLENGCIIFLAIGEVCRRESWCKDAWALDGSNFACN